MDKVIRFTLGLLLVILIAFISLVSFQIYVERAYQASLTGTYSFSCTITTDSPLANVTLFIPVPADPSGNSPVVAGFSAGTIGGIPDGWNATLYDTGKATLVKITAPAILPAAGTGPAGTVTVRMNADLPSATAIDTRDPVNSSAMFRPVGDLTQVPCVLSSGNLKGPRCYSYGTPLYADYGAAPGAMVNISAMLVGKNGWKIFEPGSNEYDTSVSLEMSGAHHGWATMNGTLMENVGTYDIPWITA